MSGRTSGKEKQQSPQRCPKCGATANLTVSVTVVPDGSSVLGGQVVWDNDTATKCGACGFIGKVADFEPTDSYSPEKEEEMEKRVAGMYGFDIEAERRREAGFRDEIRNQLLASNTLQNFSTRNTGVGNADRIYAWLCQSNLY